jgi:hypothetical protein
LRIIAWSQNLVDSVLLNFEGFWRTTFGSWRKFVSAAEIFRARKMADSKSVVSIDSASAPTAAQWLSIL